VGIWVTKIPYRSDRRRRWDFTRPLPSPTQTFE